MYIYIYLYKYIYIYIYLYIYIFVYIYIYIQYIPVSVYSNIYETSSGAKEKRKALRCLV